MEKTHLSYDAVADTILFVVTFVLTGLVKPAMLFHISEYSFFSSDRLWLSQFVDNPGGLLDFAGAFLTQFFAIPLLGAAVLGFVLVAFRRVVLLLFCDRTFSSALTSLIPPLMNLLFITCADYSLYTPGSYGLAFSQTLGLGAALTLVHLYDKLYECGWRCASAIPLSLFLTYPLLGFYALFAALVFVCGVLVRGRYARRDVPVILTVVAFSFLVPYSCVVCNALYQRMNIRFAYVSGLPYRDFTSDLSGCIPLAVGMAFVIAARLLGGHKFSLSLSLTAFVLSLSGLFTFTNWDRNLGNVLKMERSVAGADWDRVLVLASSCPDPTRVQVVYRNIALYQKGLLCDRMFSYPDGSAPIISRTPVPVSFVCGLEEYLRTGMINCAERWASELSVTYISNRYYCKCRAKAALLGGDFELAERYIAAISGNLFQREWVRHYSSFLDDPSLMASDPEFSLVIPLLGCNDDRFVTGDVAEKVVFNHFANSCAGNGYVLQWKFASLMSLKNEALFMDLFFTTYGSGFRGRIPECISQAAVLFGANSGDRDMYLDIFHIFENDRAVLKRFSNFGKSYNSVKDPESPMVIERYMKNYGDTYWFYYYFINNIVTD